jgi:hypothetical protein
MKNFINDSQTGKQFNWYINGQKKIKKNFLIKSKRKL